jgi:RTX calcium-binding nonapeptide repeat (4 copies)
MQECGSDARDVMLGGAGDDTLVGGQMGRRNPGRRLRWGVL